MHVFFSGIGGAGIGPLALIAKQAGYEVSGSDLKDGPYISYLRQQGLDDILIGQDRPQITRVHDAKPIDWFVYSSALPLDHPELVFCKEAGIKISKRDEFLNKIIEDKKLKLLAITGTHGKTTTTAMVVWLFKQLGLPASYSLGAKTSFSNMGSFEPKGKYFIYECDEFDRNFLAFHPALAVISGVSWDHHEIFKTQADYFEAFRQFVDQSRQVVLWQEDARRLELLANRPETFTQSTDEPLIEQIKLVGLYNRRDGWLVVQAVHQLTGQPVEKLLGLISKFPGVSRRFERIAKSLYTDYAHTPQKIQGVMSVALETAQQTGQKIVIIYEPLTNRRMHYMKDQHQDIFDGVDTLYWVPSYLAREDSKQPVLSPAELIKHLDAPAQALAKPMKLDDQLKVAIEKHLDKGDLVIGLSGGGAGSLDEWLRKEFRSPLSGS